MNITAIAEKYGTCEPIRICKDLDVDIRYEDMPLSVRALMFRVPEQVIIVNKKLCTEYQRFLIAHKVIHFTTHRNHDIGFFTYESLFKPDQVEREANRGAIELLLLNHEFTDASEYFRAPEQTQDMEEYAKTIGVQYNGHIIDHLLHTCV